MEIAKILAGLSVAIMSMSVVTYALAVPRLQTALSASIKVSREQRTKLERRMKEEPLTLKEIEDQLRAIDSYEKEIGGVVGRLSWNRVVVVPVSASVITLGLLIHLIQFPNPYDWLILFASIVFLLFGLLHLLFSLRLIERTAVRPELTVEGA